MSLIEQIIDEAKANNVTLYIKDGQLAFIAEQGGFSDELKAKISRYKNDIISVLLSTQLPAAIAPFGLLTDEERRILGDEYVDAYPASALQSGTVFHTQLEQFSGMYHNIIADHVKCCWDRACFEKALATCIHEHPILRTGFRLDGNRVLQVVRAAIELPLGVEDLRALTANAQTEYLAQWREECKRHVFEWEKGPLFYIQIFLRTDESFEFVMSFHHAVLDGWSRAALIAQLYNRYSDLLSGRELGQFTVDWTYRDFIALEQQILANPDAKTYFQAMLEDAPSMQLPRIGATNKILNPQQPQSFRSIKAPTSLSALVLALAKQLGVPVQSVMLAAHFKVLSTVSGYKRALSCMTYNGRPETASGERGVGLFLNSVPMCANVITGTWKHLIEHLTQVVTTSMAYRHYPLARIQEDLNTYLGEVTFNYTHFHIYEEITRRTGENHLEVLASYKFAPNSFDLNVDAVRDLNDHLSIILVYNPGVFDHALIEQMAQFYLRAFELMLERIDQPHHAQSLLSEEEIRQQLFDWNATTVPSSDEFCIHQHIEIQAAKTPNAVAVIFENQSLSYHEMNAKADRLARYLLSAGVQMNSRVGLCLRPSLEMMIGILGVMKAGAAYVPLEPRLPMERVKYMLKNAGVEWVLVDSPSRNSLPPDGIKTVLVDAVSNPEWLEKFQDGSLQVVQGRLTRENLAYVLYTSGSTGNPKGVMVPHRALSNYLAHAAAAYLDEKIEGAVVSLPLCFDATLTTLLSPLLVGKPVELLPENETALSQLAERLFKRETGWLFKLTPAHLEALEHVERPSTSLAPHMLVIGGEQLSVSTLRRWKLDLLPNASFVNEYGPTETVVGCTTWTLQGITDVAAIDGLLAAPIGRPIRNVQLYVLGEMGQLLPNNSVGELYIGGDGLARGYLNEPALTQEQFVPSPFCHSSGSRLYRTGDMVRWLPSGQMTFVGRRDNQVKIRGFRIELGEIEQQLCGLPGVDSAAVMVREDMPGGRCLTAYVVPADYPINEADRAVIEPELVNGYREALSARLPEYMIPSKFILLNNLPITQNKKIDRKALAALADLRTANHHDDDPRDDTELFLKSVWEEILQIQNISRKAKFFEIGGHSINAITLAARLAKTYHKKIRVQVIFEHPTIEQLAAYLRQEVSFSPPGSLLVIQPRGSRRPLFCVHPGGGLANCYLPLSRSLGMDQPLYGLQSYGLEDGEAPLTNIEEMAARYLGEMRTVQPQGPYQILGYSGGVIVAYEMVQQLAASGEQMPLLILIDGILPPEPIDFFREGWEQEINEWKADYIRNVLEKAGIDEKEIAADDFDAKVETYLKKAKNQFGFPDDITVAQFKRFIHLFATNIRAQLAYRAKTYLGPVHFFFANNGSREMLHHYGWGQMFMGDVCCHSLPGTHEELVDGSNAAVLGEELMPLLDQTELRLAANSAV